MRSKKRATINYVVVAPARVYTAPKVVTGERADREARQQEPLHPLQQQKPGQPARYCYEAVLPVEL